MIRPMIAISTERNGAPEREGILDGHPWARSRPSDPKGGSIVCYDRAELIPQGTIVVRLRAPGRLLLRKLVLPLAQKEWWPRSQFARLWSF